MPRWVERRIWAARYHADSNMIPDPPTSSAEGTSAIGNLAPLDPYLDEWSIASHTYQILPDHSLLIPVLLERPYGEPVA
jgi:hypothetical protein